MAIAAVVVTKGVVTLAMEVAATMITTMVVIMMTSLQETLVVMVTLRTEEGWLAESWVVSSVLH